MSHKELLLRFGGKVRGLRLRANLNGPELARRVGSTRGYIHDIEVGRKQPKEKLVRKLALALGCDQEYLLVLSGQIPSTVSEGKLLELAQSVSVKGRVKK